MARYGMKAPDEYNRFHSKSTQATKKHIIIFPLIGVAIFVLIMPAIVKAA